MKYPDVAKRITEAMAEKNLRAQDIVNLTGINKASISQYVNGTNCPSNLTASKLAKILDVSPMWLMGFDFDKHGNPTPPPVVHLSDMMELKPSPPEITPEVAIRTDLSRTTKLGELMVEASQMNENQLDRLLKIIDALKGGDQP